MTHFCALLYRLHACITDNKVEPDADMLNWAHSAFSKIHQDQTLVGGGRCPHKFLAVSSIASTAHAVGTLNDVASYTRGPCIDVEFLLIRLSTAREKYRCRTFEKMCPYMSVVAI